MTVRKVPATYATISAAVAAASPGDKIEVAPGYAGNETILVTVNNLTFDVAAGVPGISLSSDTGVTTISLLGASPVTVNGNTAANTLNGNDGTNFLHGYAGKDTLRGKNGNDLLFGGAGNDQLEGGDGQDAVLYGEATGSVVVNLLTGIATDGLGGTDKISEVEGVNGGNFADTLILRNVNGWAFGGAGNDTLTGGTGADSLYGGSGDDTIDGSEGSDTASYRDDGQDLAGVSTQGVTASLVTNKATDNWGDTDTLINIENLEGSAFKDTLIGNAGANSLRGAAGNDTLDGGAGNDFLFGGAGKDTLKGGDGFDVAFYEDATAGVVVNLLTKTAADGLGGTDTLESVESVNGSHFADTIVMSDVTGGWVFGKAGNDRITGGVGNDSIYGGSGKDTIKGGDGFDWAMYREDAFDGALGPAHGATASLATGKATDNWGDGDTLSGIENLGGSSFSDTFTGDANRNILRGEGGDDKLNGGGGNDDLIGGDGKDTLTGGDGLDYFQGGAGNDTFDGGVGYDFAWWTRAQDFDTVDYRFGPTAAVEVDLAAGTASDGQGGTDALKNIEQVFGSAFGDILKGGGDPRFQTFRGGGGNDTIIGSGLINTRADYSDSIGGVTVKLTGAATGAGTVTGGSTGSDTVRYVNQFFGSAFADTYDAKAYVLSMPFAGSGFNLFRGGAGNDTIIGNGNTRLDFGNSATGINIDLGQSTVADGLGGIDSFSGVNSVVGTASADTMLGTAAGENFTAGGGNDTINGGAGFDEARYDGGTNPYTIGIKVNMKAGTVTGDLTFVGSDKLINVEAVRGSLLDDTYVATGYASGGVTNTFRDGPLVNRNYNRFAGASGDDTITGNGQTALDYRSASAAVSVTFTAQGTGTASGKTEGTDTFTGVFSINDSVFGDTLTGSDAAAAGYWEGFNLSTGNDTVVGGGGNDFISYSAASNAAINLSFTGVGAGKATGNGTDTFSGIEYVIGSTAGDRMTGGAGNETFAGIAGSDEMDGRDGGADTVSYFFDPKGVTVNLFTHTAADGFGGADTLNGFEIVVGSRFADSVTGDAGANTLRGGDGNDTLDGGAGKDRLEGGDGKDTFAYTTALGATNVDTLSDFVSGTDRISLARSVFSTLSAGTLKPAAFIQAAAAMTTAQHIVYDVATGIVSYDADGSGAGAAIAFAKLTPKQTLVASDFKVV